MRPLGVEFLPDENGQHAHGACRIHLDVMAPRIDRVMQAAVRKSYLPESVIALAVALRTALGQVAAEEPGAVRVLLEAADKCPTPDAPVNVTLLAPVEPERPSLIERARRIIVPH